LDAAEDLAREVLFLLDSQHIFKRPLVHRDSRERKMRYPLLDQVTTEQERENLFASLKLPLATTRAAASRSDHSNRALALILGKLNQPRVFSATNRFQARV
jgi:hypothetical protein